MSVLEIIEIIHLEPVTETLFGFHIDFPLVFNQLNYYCFDLGGWVLAKDSSPVTVRVFYNHYLQAEGQNNEDRPDVIAYHGIPEAPCGFRLNINTSHLSAEFDLLITANLADKQEIIVAKIRCRQKVLQLAQPSELQPLMVTAPGRSGSTWLMLILAQHPEIVVHQQYPYEERKLNHWVSTFKLLLEPDDHAQRYGHEEKNSVRPLQANSVFEQWLEEDYFKQSSSFCQKSLEGYYKILAKSQNKQRVKYFAEKCSIPQSGSVPFLAGKLYLGSKEILLVRDPRDLVASVQAFNLQRGYIDFGYEVLNSDREFIAGLSNTFSYLLKIKEERANSIHFIRYEDLILDPYTILTNLFNYLELDSSTKTIEKILRDASQDTPELVKHRTTRSGKAADSIGRWRQDLNAESKEASQMYLNNVLTELGYPLD